MKILYIFPHPDDESFGAAHAISKQRRQGHEVYLLTLTKGGATKQRFKLGLSIEQMGEVRHLEMLKVEKVLNLSGLTVLDLPDSGLKEMDPREIEYVIETEIEKIKPDILVTYPVHGISGFHDHIISHAIVKRVFMSMRDSSKYLKRLAFFTITEDDAVNQTFVKLNFSKNEEIDCIFETDEEDRQIAVKSLACYESYKQMIIDTNIEAFIHKEVVFEIYQEKYEPKLKDLFEGL